MENQPIVEISAEEEKKEDEVMVPETEDDNEDNSETPAESLGRLLFNAQHQPQFPPKVTTSNKIVRKAQARGDGPLL